MSYVPPHPNLGLAIHAQGHFPGEEPRTLCGAPLDDYNRWCVGNNPDCYGAPCSQCWRPVAVLRWEARLGAAHKP